MTGLSYLHISDIHTGGVETEPDQHDIEYVASELVRDLERRSEFGAPDPDLLIVTGDIAARGGTGSNEYASAEQLLEKLCAASGLPLDQTLMVPGNHDVDRSNAMNDDDNRRWLEELRRGDRSLSGDAVTETDAARIEARFQAYTDFGGVGASVEAGPVPGSWVYEGRTKDDLRYTICGLNTSLLSLTQEEAECLEIGSAQRRFFDERLEQAEIGVVIGHHPLRWLRDGDLVRARLANRAQVYLAGHVHEMSAGLLSEAGSSSPLVVLAGATHRPVTEAIGAPWARDGGHAYSFGQIWRAKSGEYKAKLWPRLFDVGNQDFRTNTSLCERNQNCSREFSLIQPYRQLRASLERGPRHEELEATHAMEMLRASALTRRRALGRQRTAFPFDLNLADLMAQDQLVETRLVPFPDPPKGRPPQTINDVLTAARSGESTLVLGDPGSGKSVFAFQTLMAAERQQVLTVAIRPSELLSDVPTVIQTVLECRASNPEPAIVFLVDGIDELLAGSLDCDRVSDRLRRIADIAPIVMTSRTQEFAQLLAGTGVLDLFSNVHCIKKWELAVEVEEYFGRAEQHYPYAVGELRVLVRETDGISELATRPLYLRMLLGMDSDQLHAVTVSTGAAALGALYEGYLTKLALATRRRLVAADCPTTLDVADIWRSVASTVFSDGLNVGGEVDLGRLLGRISLPMDEACTLRSIAFLLDVAEASSEWTARFVHYSIYEYLVARDLAVFLSDLGLDYSDESARPTHRRELTAKLRKDYSRSIRPFLIEMLSAPSRSVDAVLIETLEELVRVEASSADELVAINTLVYIVSRSFPEHGDRLAALLEVRSEPFVRCSLYWALAHLGYGGIASDFVKEMAETRELRSATRAYLRYYYGDSPSVGPPIDGDDGGEAVSQTVATVGSMISAGTYNDTVSRARQIVDVVTLCDLLISRHVSVDAELLDVLEETLVGATTSGASDAFHIGVAALAVLRQSTPGQTDID